MKASVRAHLSAVAVALLALGAPAGAQLNVDHPNVARGFSPEKLYDFGGIDAVDLFSGGLSLTIPIGPAYPVNGNLSYGLSLHYSSKIWEYEERVTQAATYLRAKPQPGANAGVGWRLSLGELLPPTSDRNKTALWVYVAPDGGTHRFQELFSDGQAGDPSTVCYTRDSTYLRLKGVGACAASGVATAPTVELPDGAVHTFEAVGTGTARYFRPTQLRDAFGNKVRIDYFANPIRWTLTDDHNRVQTIYFRTTAWIHNVVVDKVELTSPAGTATYTFNTQDVTITRSCDDNDPMTDDDPTTLYPIDEARVTILKSVTLPDGSSYVMDSYESQCQLGAGMAGADAPGVLKRIVLPTRGKIAFGYQTLDFVQRQTHPAPDDPGGRNIWFNGIGQSTGIATRTLLDASDNVVGTWLYTVTPATAPDYVRRVVVTSPRGDDTVNWFVESDNTWDYGLPMKKRPSDPLGSRYLSQQFYSGSISAATPSLLRSTYARYERDSSVAMGAGNRRLAGSSTTYHDDEATWSASEMSDWDGKGHYRVTTGSGSVGGDARTTTIGYSTGPPTWGSPWILGTYASRRLDADGGTAITEYCFDPSNGALLRTRALKDPTANGAGQGARDVLTVYATNNLGNVTSEARYGGDSAAQALAFPAPLCTMALPVAPDSGASYDYQYGTRRKETKTSASFADYEATIGTTGQPIAVIDTSGLQTDYVYDTMGRLLWNKPAGEGGLFPAWTEYRYTPASVSVVNGVPLLVPAKVAILERSDGRTTPPSTGSSVLRQQETVFDAFGRVALERRQLPLDESSCTATRPDNCWVERATTYYPTGEVKTISEWGRPGSGVGVTSYKELDAFGRPRRITPPDGPDHDLTFSYYGVRRVERNSRVASSWGDEGSTTRKERYDAAGRLVEVLEHAIQSTTAAIDETDAATLVSTVYTYDVGGRLARVNLGGQQRRFDYDGRGFLISETHPELGAPGAANGTMSYSDYDTRGYAGTVSDGLNTLTYVRDALGRVSTVKNGATTLEAFVYDGADSGRSVGKLTQASRLNRITLGGTLRDILVTDTYKYWELGGRLSEQSVGLWLGGSSTAEDPCPIGAADSCKRQPESFKTFYEYDAAGNVTSTGYPNCLFSSCASVLPTTPSYADVPNNYGSHDEVEAIRRAGVTTDSIGSQLLSGCTAGSFCPSATVTRGQAAAYLLRSKNGTTTNAQPVCNPASLPFADVNCSTPFAGYINDMLARGITSGTGIDPATGKPNYSPNQILTRTQLAVFLGRLAHGEAPTICDSNLFTDDTTGCNAGSQRAWTQDAVRRGFLTPISASTFGPSVQVTRAMMATALTKAFSLDRAGNAANGWAVNNSYLFGALSTVVLSGDGTTAIKYHPSGLPTKITLPNGTRIDTVYAPNGLGRPNSIATVGVLGYRPGAPAVAANWSSGTYAYDGDGNVKAIGTWQYQYDRVDRLVGARVYPYSDTGSPSPVEQTFTHDPYGNLRSVTVSTGGSYAIDVNARNRLTSPSATYDTAGNMTRWGVTGTNYEYDPFRQVNRVIGGGATVAYAYDAAGERTITFFVDNTQPRALWTLRNVEGKPLADYEARRAYFAKDGALWNLAQDYVWRGSSLLASIGPGTVGTRYYALDHLGTPRLISNAYSQLVARHDYYPFGEEATPAQEGFKLKFTGHERDGSVTPNTWDDLDYMHARHYNPQIGRFTSVDPLLGGPGHPQSWNRYSYVQGNPTRFVDPQGLLLQLASCTKDSASSACAYQQGLIRNAVGAKAAGYLQFGAGGSVSLAGISARAFGRQFGSVAGGLARLIVNPAAPFRLVTDDPAAANRGNSGGAQFVDNEDGPGGTIFLDPGKFPKLIGGVDSDSTEVMVHEVGHALGTLYPGTRDAFNQAASRSLWTGREGYATAFQNRYRLEILGLGSSNIRQYYTVPGDLLLPPSTTPLFPE